MTDLHQDASLAGTARDIAAVLGLDPERFHYEATGFRDRITLDNAQARRLLAFASREPLIAAFNQVFDWKDQQTPGSPEFVLAAEVIREIARGITLLGLPMPTRFDGPRVEMP